jgi:phage minor structural protein
MIGDINYNIKPQKLDIFLAKPDRTIIAKLSEAYQKTYDMKLGNINELSISIPYDIEISHILKRNPNVDLIKDRFLLKAVLNGKEEWYTIRNIQDGMEEDKDVKIVTAYLLPYEMNDKLIGAYKEDGINLSTALNGGTGIDTTTGQSRHVDGILDNTRWTVSYIDAAFDTKYRTVEVSGKTILDAIMSVAETFQALILWNTNNRTISFVNADNVGQNKGFKLSYGKYLKTLSRQVNSDEMVTRLIVFGKDNISVQKYNITGQNYLQDFSYFMYPFQFNKASRTVIKSSDYMSDELCIALFDYSDFIETKDGQFNTLLDQLKTYELQMTTKKNELATLNEQLAVIQNEYDIESSAGNDTSDLKDDKNSKLSEITSKQTEITTLQGQINTVDAQISTLRESIDMSNFINETLALELNDFIIEKEWSNQDYVDEKDLFEEAQRQFVKMKNPQFVINIDMVNFLEIIESQRDWDKLSLGDTIVISYEKMDINVTAKIIEINIDYEDGSISLVIANTKDIETDEEKLIKMLYSTTSVSTTIDMGKYKWDEIASTKSLVDNIINNTWDAIKTSITAGVNNTVSINERGILVRNTNDPLSYLIIQNSVLAITNDDGNTWKNAITKDGIVAERLFGKIIAGVNLTIDASDSGGQKLFTVDGNGVTIAGTKLTITNGLPKEQISPSYVQEIEDMGTSLQGEINDLNESLSDTQTYIDEAFKDSVIDSAEKLSIKEHLNMLSNEKTDIDNRYNIIYPNAYLFDDGDTAKTGLSTSKSDYNTKYNNLINAINTAIVDSAIIETERVNVNNAFTAYRTSIGTLSTAFEKAIDNISKHKAVEAENNAKNELSDFVSVVYASDLAQLQNQIDGSITTWFYDYVPTTSNIPASDWSTTELKNIHLGDLFYDTTTGYTYRYTLNISTYEWVRITDVDVTKALADASKAQDTADQKRRVFIATPIPPYDTGDLWQTNGSVDLKICIVSKADGQSFSSSDWSLATSAKSYIDTAKSELQSDITDVDLRVTSLNTYVDGSFYDGVITLAEAKSIEKYINSLNSEKLDLDNRYTKLFGNAYLTNAIYKTELSNAKTDFNSKHTALISAINTAISDGLTSATEKTAVDTAFANYRTALGRLSNAMEDALDDISINKAIDKAVDAETNAKSYADGLKAVIDGDISDLSTDVSNLDTYVDGTFKDNIVSQAEAKSIEKYINSLNADKLDIDNRYLTIYNNTYLTDATKKTALLNAKNDFDSKHTALISSINTAILDGVTSSAEKSDVDTKFSNYRTSLGNLATAFENAIDDISKKKAEEAESNAKNASVQKGQAYNGVTIDANNGLVITKSDNTFRSVFNAGTSTIGVNGLAFQKLEGSTWVNKLYYDATSGNLTIDGAISARSLKIGGVEVLVNSGTQISGAKIDKIKATQIDVTEAKISSAQIGSIYANQIIIGGGTISDTLISSSATWNGKETPSGAQAKADSAKTAAQSYASILDSGLRTDLRLIAPLPNHIELNSTGILITATGTNKWVKLDNRGIVVNNGAIQIDSSDGTTFINGSGINADKITSGTITGRTVQTASSGGRVELLSGYADINVYSASGGLNILKIEDGGSGAISIFNPRQVNPWEGVYAKNRWFFTGDVVFSGTVSGVTARFG